MKKLFSIVALLLMAFAMNAQDKAEFNPYWYLQLQGGVGYTIGESTNPIDHLSYPAVGLNIGWQFSPIVGARINFNGFEGKGALPQQDGNLLWNWNYAQGGLDFLFNLRHLGGYKGATIFNPYLFLGAACNYAFNNSAPAMADYPISLANRWDPSLPKEPRRCWRQGYWSPSTHLCLYRCGSCILRICIWFRRAT